MKKKITVLALCVLMLAGCGNKIPTLSNGDEAVVTLKNGEMISANDLYNELKSQYALDTLVSMVDKKILEDKYKDHISEAEESTKTTMEQLEAAYGDDLESAIQYYTGFANIEAYKNSLYVKYFQDLAITDYAKKELKEKDIKKYYDDEIVGDIKVSHLLISSKAKDDMSADEKKKAEEEAKEKINAIITELKNTKKDEIATKFAALASEKSEDQNTKENGGSLGFINKDTLSSTYDELVKAAYKLKDGEFSTSIITTELGYHVILRTETKEKASFEEVEDTIKDKLASEYLEKNPVTQVKALQEVRKEYGIDWIDSDLQTKYAESIQSQINYYTKQAEENKNKVKIHP